MPKKIKKPKQKHFRTQKEFAPAIVETKDFSAKVIPAKDGRGNELEYMSMNWYRHQINKFKVGEKVTVYVSSRRPKRTVQQNRYYWFYLNEICKETGESEPERLHKLFSGMFLSDGIVEVMGQKVRLTKSTTSLSKADFGEYIEKISAFTEILAPSTVNYFDEAPQV